MIDFNSFEKALPQDLIELLDFFNEQGFRAGLIGGIPRDYLNQAIVGDDFDIELRPSESIKDEELLDAFFGLGKKLKSIGLHARERGYKVFEVKLKNSSAEFTLPRIETFGQGVHHSNFSATHISDRDYKLGFKRRDFSINAIMFERFAKTWKLVDPMNGLEDLRANTLRACDHGQFIKDPVRFLRAVRFSVRFGLHFDPNLLTLLKNMELSLSPHYLKLESSKSLWPFSFLLVCMDLRAEILELSRLRDFQSTLEEYEDAFPCKDIREHIEQALFLPDALRAKILTVMGISPKRLLRIDLKAVNLGKLLSMSLKELSLCSWAAPFIDFLSKADSIEERKLEWLLEQEGCEFTADFIYRFRKLKIPKPEGIDASLIRFSILQEKVRILTEN